MGQMATNWRLFTPCARVFGFFNSCKYWRTKNLTLEITIITNRSRHLFYQLYWLAIDASPEAFIQLYVCLWVFKIPQIVENLAYYKIRAVTCFLNARGAKVAEIHCQVRGVYRELLAKNVRLYKSIGSALQLFVDDLRPLKIAPIVRYALKSFYKCKRDESGQNSSENNLSVRRNCCKQWNVRKCVSTCKDGRLRYKVGTCLRNHFCVSSFCDEFPQVSKSNESLWNWSRTPKYYWKLLCSCSGGTFLWGYWTRKLVMWYDKCLNI